MVTEEVAGLKLYTYWRSSAAYRVRIALNLKGLTYESIPVHLLRNGGEHQLASYREMNSQGLVPVLVHGDRVVTQSMAICEYLEECFPQPPLLPEGIHERALIRSLALQVACEIHPLNNLRVQKYLDVVCAGAPDKPGWMAHWMNTGFEAIEKKLATMGGAMASRPGLFECFLVPQVYNAERYGIDMTGFPGIGEIVKRCRELPAFQQAAPEKQPDAAPD